MTINPLNDISRVYLEQIAESAVPGQPAERLGAVTAIPKSDQDAARLRTLAKAKAMREKKGIKEAAKPDYLDFDRDGNKIESMKKALKDRKKHEVDEANDGNLANNYPPYNKVTRGDVIAGRLGKDQLGGKKKKVIANEGYSNWREDLKEIVEVSDKKTKSSNSPIKEKNVNNYSGKDKCVTIGPDIKEEIKILECIELGEAVYGGEPKKAEAPKDTRMVVTKSDKTANTIAYQKFKSGDKRYRAADHLTEKAESEQQQKLFGLALSVKRGETPRSEASAEVLKIVDSMSEKEIRKFAKTKHKGIPKKVEEELQPSTPKQIAAQQQLISAQKKVALADQEKLKKQKTANEPIEEAQQKIKGKLPSGTRTFTGMGYYGRTSTEKKNPKQMKKIFPEPRERSEYDDENPPRRRYRDDHPSLTAGERNPNLR